ncbi:MAG: heavy-metal-associated domain-containing protein [Betaproteobacteria bacterium]|nr:heavy-metal-associated domain-containing protein [Betaproteobacteria bacterium]MBI3938156.1 heavy-metal-associated domain-containing protein [Betaproteobacteria bacterium]
MAVTLNVVGMTCSHCVHAVTKALKAVAGVEKVSVSLDAGRAQVEGTAKPPALIRAVEEEGYKAQMVDSK